MNKFYKEKEFRSKMFLQSSLANLNNPVGLIFQLLVINHFFKK